MLATVALMTSSGAKDLQFLNIDRKSHYPATKLPGFFSYLHIGMGTGTDFANAVFSKGGYWQQRKNVASPHTPVPFNEL